MDHSLKSAQFFGPITTTTLSLGPIINMISLFSTPSLSREIMDFPVLSQSKSLRFPSDFLEKPKPYFPIRRSSTPLWSTTNHTPPSVPALSKTSSIKCTVKETQNQEPFQSENGRKGWIHFVGIGGCGLSALAMLALKQVSVCVCVCVLSLMPCLVSEKVNILCILDLGNG